MCNSYKIKHKNNMTEEELTKKLIKYNITKNGMYDGIKKQFPNKTEEEIYEVMIERIESSEKNFKDLI